LVVATGMISCTDNELAGQMKELQPDTRSSKEW